MKLLELRNDCFFEITKFLNLDELIRIKTVCKFFGLFLEKYKHVFQQRFCEPFGIKNEENLDSWEVIWKRMKSADDSTCFRKEAFIPYYTDGGTYGQSEDYFIHNLITDCTYCTTEKNNILVKYYQLF